MIKQFSYLAAGRIISALLQLWIFVVLARDSGPELFGLIVAVVGIAIIPQSFLDFGISTYVLKSRTSSTEAKYVRSALGVNNRTSIVLALFGIFGLVIAGIVLNNVFFLMIPLALWAASEKNADTWLSIAIADGDTRLNVVNMVGRRLTSLAVYYLLTYFMVNVVLSYSLAMAIGGISANIYSKIVISKRIGNLKESYSFKDILKLSRPYWMHSFATQLRNLDTTLVAILANPMQAGFYALGARLSGPLRLLPTSLAPILLAQVSASGLNKKIVNLLLISVGILAFLYTAIVFMVPILIELFFGIEFVPATLSVQILCFGLIFGATASLLAAVLQGLGRQRFVGCVSMISAFVSLVGIVVGTLAAGSAGAAVGMVLSFVVQSFSFTIKLLFSRRTTDGSL